MPLNMSKSSMSLKNESFFRWMRLYFVHLFASSGLSNFDDSLNPGDSNFDLFLVQLLKLFLFGRYLIQYTFVGALFLLECFQ